MVRATDRSNLSGSAECSFVDLADSVRVAIMITPKGRGSFRKQAREALSVMQSIVAQRRGMTITVQTIFLRNSAESAEIQLILAGYYGSKLPITNYVLQPPCCGAALAIEAWGIGGESVRIERFGPETLAVSYDGVRWIYCAGIRPTANLRGVYVQSMDALAQIRAVLVLAGSGFENIVRTWFYLGGITEPEGDTRRYQELNRARADFYQDIHFCPLLVSANAPRGVYPASTGIGMSGEGLVTSCVALETKRNGAFLVPLENPQQTPAYAYHPRFSNQSPKFTRAMALVLDNYVTTWVSGTASIVNAESRHPNDIEKQTEQAIENIERLIAAENFALHGLNGAGASLRDMAKVRIYLKRPDDFAKCKAICERRFGPVPAIYAVADVCRPELLVEIEGVAFSRCSLT